MEFSADYQTVTRRLEQTDEFVRILHGEDEFPASYFFDVRYSLKRIRPEGTWLDEKELFDLKRSLQTINDIIRFFRPSLEEGEEIKYPALTALAGDIQVFPQLIGKIDAILDKFGRVKDNASSSLAQKRKVNNVFNIIYNLSYAQYQGFLKPNQTLAHLQFYRFLYW